MASFGTCVSGPARAQQGFGITDYGAIIYLLVCRELPFIKSYLVKVGK